jgi:hypothetical protein
MKNTHSYTIIIAVLLAASINIVGADTAVDKTNSTETAEYRTVNGEVHTVSAANRWKVVSSPCVVQDLDNDGILVRAYNSPRLRGLFIKNLPRATGLPYGRDYRVGDTLPVFRALHVGTKTVYAGKKEILVDVYDHGTPVDHDLYWSIKKK